MSYLKLDLSLGDVLLAAAAASNLLGLGDLGADVLTRECELVLFEIFEGKETYVSAEVLKSETLDSVDAELGVGLDNGETTGDY